MTVLWFFSSLFLYIYLVVQERKYKGYLTILDLLAFLVLAIVSGPIGIVIVVCALLYVYYEK